jgi:hypothetical protein
MPYTRWSALADDPGFVPVHDNVVDDHLSELENT